MTAVLRRQRVRYAIGAGAAAALAATALAVVPSAQAAATPGWRLFTSRHRGAASDFDILYNAVAVSKTNAWAFGGAYTQNGSSRPIAEHWNGRHWKAAALPAGLSGPVYAASATGGGNVWAVGLMGGFVLHYDGAKWLVAKQWPPTAGLPPLLTGVTALSSTNVWVFGAPGSGSGPGAWHLTGRTWTRVTGRAAGIIAASALSRHDIWAFGSSKVSPGAIIEHYNGHVWKTQRASVLDGVEFTSILALGRANVWASGGKVSGNSFVPWLVHWNGTNWARVTPSGAALPYYPVTDGHGPMAATRAVAKAAAKANVLESGDLTPDGSGGIWLTASTTANVWYAVHRTRSGQWQRYRITNTGLMIGVAHIPGTTALWGVGLTPTRAGAINAAIWAYGPVR